MTAPLKYDWKKARKLYDAGCNDTEIARELAIENGCSTVWKWRTRNRLPANRQQRQHGTLTPKIKKCLASGLSPREIAAELNCRPEYVRAVRRRTKPGASQQERLAAAHKYRASLA